MPLRDALLPQDDAGGVVGEVSSSPPSDTYCRALPFGARTIVLCRMWDPQMCRIANGSSPITRHDAGSPHRIQA